MNDFIGANICMLRSDGYAGVHQGYRAFAAVILRMKWSDKDLHQHKIQ